MSQFQDFLYVDDDTVSRMLSSIEGGEFDTVDERIINSSDRLDAADPAGVFGQATSSSQSERNRSIRQTPEARFARLWKAVTDDPEEDVAKWPDSGVFAPVEGQFCQLQGILGVPQMIAILAASSELLQLGQMMEQFGVAVGNTEMEQLEAISAMKELIKDRFPVVLTLSGEQRTAILPLDSASSRVRVDAYLGRATVYGRIVESIPSGGTFPLVNIPGAAHISQPSRQQRRAAGRGKASAQSSNENEVAGPALVLKVLAIAQ